MADREQPSSFTERIRKVTFADGADSAFDLLVQEGWVLSPDEVGSAPPGYRIFATATWEHRIVMRDSDQSLWALRLEG